MKWLIDMAIKEITKELLPNISIKKFKVIKIYRKRDYLGFYEDYSINDIPIIKLNITGIKNAYIEYPNISKYEIILSTIIHELGHALQELKGKPFDEEEAENFAFNFCRLGIVNKI